MIDWADFIALWSSILLIVKNYSKNERAELHSEAISKLGSRKAVLFQALQCTVNFGMKSPTDTESVNNVKQGKKTVLLFVLIPCSRCILPIIFSPNRGDANSLSVVEKVKMKYKSLLSAPL